MNTFFSLSLNNNIKKIIVNLYNHLLIAMMSHTIIMEPTMLIVIRVAHCEFNRLIHITLIHTHTRTPLPLAT